MYKFISVDLNKSKFQYILKYAQQINLCKNQLSTIYFKKFYHNITKNEFRMKMIEYLYNAFDFSLDYFKLLCDTIYNKYKNDSYKRPIKFSKLEFWATNISNQPMFMKSKNKHTNGIITLNLDKTIMIPFKLTSQIELHNIQYERINNKYHINYQCVLNPLQQCVIIKIFNHTNTYKFLGVDINVTSNLFTCSDGHIIDYDRNLMNKIINNHNAKKNFNRCHTHIMQKLTELIKYAKTNNYNHLIFEDLTPFLNDINMNNTYMHLFHLFDIAKLVKALGKKYKIFVSFVPAAYTSQTCPICGYIAENNRIDQSHFHCINCGYQNNADINAAINIRQRIASKILRDQLTNEHHHHFEPKPLTIKQIYQILRQFYIDRS